MASIYSYFGSDRIKKSVGWLYRSKFKLIVQNFLKVHNWFLPLNCKVIQVHVLKNHCLTQFVAEILKLVLVK